VRRPSGEVRVEELQMKSWWHLTDIQDLERIKSGYSGIALGLVFGTGEVYRSSEGLAREGLVWTKLKKGQLEGRKWG